MHSLALTLSVLLGGCAIHISQDTTIDSTMFARSVVIDAPARLILRSDAQLRAVGDIVVYGAVSGAELSNVSLHSESGRITVWGSIHAADGTSGAPAFSPPATLVAGDGKPGGDISLMAPHGSVELMGGSEVKAGAGGNGGNAYASGPGDSVRARSGRGGRGGQVNISSHKRVDISGEVRAGRGGDGGAARANGGAGGEEPVAAKFAEAFAQSGGRGGDVILRIGSPSGQLIVTGGIYGGRGGNSNQAKSDSAQSTLAVSQVASDGGNVEINVSSPSQYNDAGSAIQPGGGGATGAITPAAVATALVGATAETGDGGHGGKVILFGGPIRKADGGDSGDSWAQTPGRPLNVDSGKAHNGSIPAAGTRATSP